MTSKEPSPGEAAAALPGASRRPSRAAPVLEVLRVLVAAVPAVAVRMRAALKAAVLRTMPSETQYVFVLTIVIGGVCGLVAVGFHLTIRAAEHLLIDRALAASGHGWIAWTLVSPTLGGLAAGALLLLAPAARGSGIPQVKEAFAAKDGRLRLRDAVAKFVICALQIGSGASLGREGPTVHICAATAGWVGRIAALPPKSAKRLVPVGVAAGIAAAFNAPIAAVTFTIEEVVGRLDQTVLSGVVIAAAVAAVIERSVLGTHPIIAVEHGYALEHASSLPFYALLGLCAAFVSVLFTDGLLALRLAARRVKSVPAWSLPAVGGLVTGALAVACIASLGVGGVTGGGYETLGLSLAGKLAVPALVALCFSKLAATVFSYSTGGAGGVFAPALFIGAMLGGVLGYVDVAALGHEGFELGAFALVGMGACFAGIVRAPITSVLIIFEMTGGYGLVLPLMIANSIAYGVARHLRPTPLYEALLEQDGVHLPDPAARPPALSVLPVRAAMTAQVLALSDSDEVAEAFERVRTRGYAVFPVLDGEGRLTGVVTHDLLEDACASGSPRRPLSELRFAPQTIAADAPLSEAALRMSESGARTLVVLDDAGRLAGVLSMSDIVRGHARAVREDKAGPAAAPAQGEALLSTHVGLLATDAKPVPASTPLSKLVDLLIVAPSGALPLEPGAAGHAVLLLDAARGVLAERAGLDHVIVAADVARPVPYVSSDDELLRALQLMDEHDVDALPVVDEGDAAASAIITRAQIGQFLFDHYARNAQRSTSV